MCFYSQCVESWFAGLHLGYSCTMLLSLKSNQRSISCKWSQTLEIETQTEKSRKYLLTEIPPRPRRHVLTQIYCLASALFGLHASHNALQAMLKLVAKRPIEPNLVGSLGLWLFWKVIVFGFKSAGRTHHSTVPKTHRPKLAPAVPKR